MTERALEKLSLTELRAIVFLLDECAWISPNKDLYRSILALKEEATREIMIRDHEIEGD